VKRHTQVDLRGLIPTVVHITEGKRADVTFLDDLAIEAGAFYIMDRGYVDFERLHRFTHEAAFFVTRTKKGIRFRRRTSHPVDFATGLQSDHTVGLATAESRRTNLMKRSRSLCAEGRSRNEVRHGGRLRIVDHRPNFRSAGATIHRDAVPPQSVKMRRC
jgi:Transposase DDE domain